jgi:hypothetical protein
VWGEIVVLDVRSREPRRFKSFILFSKFFAPSLTLPRIAREGMERESEPLTLALSHKGRGDRIKRERKEKGKR